jgi:hypothetical protein
VRSSVTESWGFVPFALTNPTDTDRRARVVVSYMERREAQYGRDVWVPAHSSLQSWLLLGPSPPLKVGRDQFLPKSREIQIDLFLREGGEERRLLPRGQEVIRSRALPYRRRESSTAILLDDPLPDEPTEGRFPEPDSRDDEAIMLVRTVRHARNLSEAVTVVNPGPLPPLAQAFDGIDLFVLASERIAHDPAGLRALRHWLEQGGRVWVMLDRVGPDVLAPLLGSALDFEVVARARLTDFAVAARPTGGLLDVKAPVQHHERPVDFVRVLLPPGEQAAHAVHGWPAWFTRRVGRGTVVVTTLGPRGWARLRTRKDGPSRYRTFPSLPFPTPALEAVADHLEPPPEAASFSAEAFRPLLTAEIGYSVLDRNTVALVFGGSLLAALILAIVLRRTRRQELLGWLGPAAALAAAAIFVALGESSRRAAPPTVAVAQVVHAVPGQAEVAAHGLLAAYRPDSGRAEIGARRGGFFELDTGGIEGQIRRLIVTDLDAWHWENLDLPAGVRFAPFRTTVPTGEPLAASARFGPEGLEGRLTPGPFRDVADAVLNTPNRRSVAVRLQPDGSFRAGSPDVLAPGQFLPGAVLSDQQQRRQDLYREFLKHPPRGGADGQAGSDPVLLAWAEPIDLGFALVPRARRLGTALLVIPLRLERTPPGTRVIVPGPLVAVRRLVDEAAAVPLQREGQQAVAMHLRFQLPAAVLPLKVERARLALKIDAPGRRVTVSAYGPAGKLRELRRVDSPLDPIRLDLTGEGAPRLDEAGGLHLDLAIGDSARGSNRWAIEYLELEVTGQTEAGR